METVMKLALTAAMMIGTAHTASAAVITRTYTITSVFDATAPVTAVTNVFTLTFDPSTRANSVAVDAYTTSSTSLSFAGPIGYTTSSSSPSITNLYLGRLPSVAITNTGEYDFNSLIQVNAFGDVLASFSSSTIYSVPQRMNFYSSVSQVVTVSPLVTAVPEPATWAMMLVGFGMVAATARYRRRSAKVSLA